MKPARPIPLADRWGPFAADIDEPERRARLRAMRAIARLLCGIRARDLAQALAAAEQDATALPQALAALDNLTALDRRHVLAAYAKLGATP